MLRDLPFRRRALAIANSPRPPHNPPLRMSGMLCTCPGSTHSVCPSDRFLNQKELVWLDGGPLAGHMTAPLLYVLAYIRQYIECLEERGFNRARYGSGTSH